MPQDYPVPLQYGTPEAQRALVALLDDEEVQAAVINAMRLSKQDGHCDRIAEIKRSATRGAARHEASKYLKRFCGTA